MDRQLPERCDCFSPASLDKEVTWLKRQEQVEGKMGNERKVMRLRDYRDTLRELLAQVSSLPSLLLSLHASAAPAGM